jgi:hypothetical protein
MVHISTLSIYLIKWRFSRNGHHLHASNRNAEMTTQSNLQVPSYIRTLLYSLPVSSGQSNFRSHTSSRTEYSHQLNYGRSQFWISSKERWKVRISLIHIPFPCNSCVKTLRWPLKWILNVAYYNQTCMHRWIFMKWPYAYETHLPRLWNEIKNFLNAAIQVPCKITFAFWLKSGVTLFGLLLLHFRHKFLVRLYQSWCKSNRYSVWNFAITYANSHLPEIGISINGSL